MASNVHYHPHGKLSRPIDIRDGQGKLRSRSYGLDIYPYGNTGGRTDTFRRHQGLHRQIRAYLKNIRL